MVFVLDASAAMSWAFEDEIDPAADAILSATLEEDISVPPIWPYEIANTLRVAGQRGRVSEPDAAALAERLARLPVVVEPSDVRPVLDRVLPLARVYRLTVYDAAYLDLALRTQRALFTRDDELREAAARAGVQLLG